MTTWDVIAIAIAAVMVAVLLVMFVRRELRLYRETHLPAYARPTLQERPWPGQRLHAAEMTFDTPEARERLGRLQQ